jgi:ABC-type antimicrobial peptide transport system permease subunit
MAARRRAEIGVRIALGAERRHILVMMFVDVARMVVLGLAIGSALTMGLSDVARTLLYQIDPRDATTLGLAAGLLAAVGLVAALIPAQGAARVDPVQALRES